MHLIVNIPNNFLPERKYAIEILLNYFKDVTYELVYEEKDYTTFSFNKQAFLKVKDAFWNDLNEGNFDYKSLKTPQKIDELEINTSKVKTTLLSIFGEANYHEGQDCLILNSDIIASTFFMLTRWEEYVSNEKDEFNRFPDQSSLLYKNNYTHRPLVNEYLDYLRLLLSSLSSTPIEYNRNYQLHITHDVDEIYRLKPFSKFIKVLGGDLINRKSIGQFFKTISKKFNVLVNDENDPSDTFDYLMDISEKYGNVSKFYFIPGESGEKDFRYSISSKSVKNIIGKIKSRNHKVGIHPSLETNGNEVNFDMEVSRLSNVYKENITEGRHHYLAFQVPFTWRYWDKNKIKYDSSLGYRNGAGFRCGFCYDFPVFDILERKVLLTRELPLTLMEVGLTHAKKSPEEFLSIAVELANTVKKHKGDFVLLWHNNNLNHPFYQKYGNIYESLISKISD